MTERCWINVAVIVLITCSVGFAQDVTYYLEEEQPNGTFLGNIGQDSNLFTTIGDTESSLIFSFISTGREYATYFRLDEQTSDLYTNTIIDREQVCEFMQVCLLSLQVAAKSPLGSFFRILKLDIYIKDRNDHAPVFEEPSLKQQISEAVLVGTSFAIEGARDRDTSAEFSLKSYEIKGNDSLEQIGIPFTVQFVKHLDGSSTVRLFVTEPLDREKVASYDFDIIAKDGGTPPRLGKLPVYITVLDENDNPPMFTSDKYHINITETFPVSGTIITILADDPDFDNNGRVGYRFSPHQSAQHFKYFNIDELTGKITTKERIVYSPGKTFNLIVEAFDHAPEGQRLTSQALVVIQVDNEGNTPPDIKVSTLSGARVSEQANVGTVIAYIRIEDHDSGRQGIVGCILDSNMFELQPMRMNQYKVVVSGSLDYETQSGHNVTVHCQDDGTPPLQASETFIITVTDENDNTPHFSKSDYTERIRENLAFGERITSLNVTDLDSGLNGQAYFTVSLEVMDMFYFDNSTTDVNSAVLRVNGTLDREMTSSYRFAVYAIDKGSPSKTGTATVSLQLTDINDEAPTFPASPVYLSVTENRRAGVTVGTITARDQDLGVNSHVTYSLHPQDSHKLPFIVSQNGLIETTRTLDKEEMGQYEFRVIATDRGEPPLSSTGYVVVTVEDVNDNSPVFEFPSLYNNTVNVHFTTMPWQVIAHVKASDLDETRKDNYQLKYSINDRNDSNHFQINPKTGEIQIIQELDGSYLGKAYKLDILVSDLGEPLVRSTVSPLFIKIISSNLTNPGVSDTLGGKNFVIIVIIGAVTIVLSLGILITICLIGKIDRQRKLKERNKTLDADPDSKPFDGSITVFSLPSEDSLITDRRTKEVSFSLEDDVFSDDDLLQKNGQDRRNNHYNVSCRYLVPIASRVEDTHSETSGDTATSDSGRGGSDDEIHATYTRTQPPIDNIIDVNTEIQPMSHQEIIPFSFKKGSSLLRDVERDSLKEGHSFSRIGDMGVCTIAVNTETHAEPGGVSSKCTYTQRPVGRPNGHVVTVDKGQSRDHCMV